MKYDTKEIIYKIFIYNTLKKQIVNFTGKVEI